MKNSADETEMRQQVLLCFQVALLGMVGPHLRGVTVQWSERLIQGNFLFDGPVSDDDIETASEVETEVMASFPNHEVKLWTKRLDAPKDMKAETMGAWVYWRKE